MIEITAEIRAFIDKAAAGVELAEDEYIDLSDVNDRSEPDYATLCTIAEALQVSVDYLLGRNGIQDSDFQGSRIFSDFIIGREKPASEGFFFDLLHAGGQGVFFKNGSRFDTGIAKNIETVQVGHEIQRLGREELESSPRTVPADAVGVQGCFRCCRPLESFKDLFIGRHGLLQARTDFLRAEWLDVGAKAALLVLGFVNRSGYRCLACSAQEGEKAQNEALFATAHVCHDSFRPKGAE